MGDTFLYCFTVSSYRVRSSIRSKYISRVCMGCMADCSSAVLLPCRKVHSSSSVENRNLKPFR